MESPKTYSTFWFSSHPSNALRRITVNNSVPAAKDACSHGAPKGRPLQRYGAPLGRHPAAPGAHKGRLPPGYGIHLGRHLDKDRDTGTPETSLQTPPPAPLVRADPEHLRAVSELTAAPGQVCAPGRFSVQPPSSGSSRGFQCTRVPGPCFHPPPLFSLLTGFLS